MVNKARDRSRQPHARNMLMRYAYLAAAVVFLMSMVCMSGCRRNGTDQNTAQNRTVTAAESISQSEGAGGPASDSQSEGAGGPASEDGTSDGGGLSDLPLIIDMTPGNDYGDPETDGADSGEKPDVAAGENDHAEQNGADEEDDQNSPSVEESGRYTSKDEVALYIHLFGHLPSNYITKSEAEELGWESNKGNLAEVAPGMSIGGNHFGNYEKRLPSEKGRTYFECDINYESGYRGSERLIFSNDGLVFYTSDHYETFEQLY